MLLPRLQNKQLKDQGQALAIRRQRSHGFANIFMTCQVKKREWINRVRTQFVSIIVGQQANFYPPMQCI